jgi:hypothetical protein
MSRRRNRTGCPLDNLRCHRQGTADCGGTGPENTLMKCLPSHLQVERPGKDTPQRMVCGTPLAERRHGL